VSDWVRRSLRPHTHWESGHLRDRQDLPLPNPKLLGARHALSRLSPDQGAQIETSPSAESEFCACQESDQCFSAISLWVRRHFC